MSLPSPEATGCTRLTSATCCGLTELLPGSTISAPSLPNNEPRSKKEGKADQPADYRNDQIRVKDSTNHGEKTGDDEEGHEQTYEESEPRPHLHFTTVDGTGG